MSDRERAERAQKDAVSDTDIMNSGGVSPYLRVWAAMEKASKTPAENLPPGEKPSSASTEPTRSAAKTEVDSAISHPRPTGAGWVTPKGDPYSYKKDGENFIVFNSKTGQQTTVKPGTKSKLDPSVDAYAKIAELFPAETPPASGSTVEMRDDLKVQQVEKTAEAPVPDDAEDNEEDDEEEDPNSLSSDPESMHRKMRAIMQAAAKKTDTERKAKRATQKKE